MECQNVLFMKGFKSILGVQYLTQFFFRYMVLHTDLENFAVYLCANSTITHV